jgi:hypothetical protein
MQTRFVRTASAVAACVLFGASVASAQVTRTWVSALGDDANPCSRTAPCKTFAGAIAKTATGGEISVLDPGGYGAVTITKAITINGVGEHASVLATLSSNGIIINTPAGVVVTLKNLIINGAGSGNIGIRLLSGTNLIIDNVHVLGFDTGLQTNGGLTVFNSGLLTNNRSFGVNAIGGAVSIEASAIVANTMGVQTAPGATVRLTNNGIYNNATSIGCGGGTVATAANNRLAGNTGGPAPCSPTVAITIQ